MGVVSKGKIGALEECFSGGGIDILGDMVDDREIDPGANLVVIPPKLTLVPTLFLHFKVKATLVSVGFYVA